MRRLLLGLLALVLLVSACSSGDGTTEASTTTTTTTIPTTTTIRSLTAEEVDTSASPYCAVWARILKVPPPMLTGDAAASRKARYTVLLPIVAELVAAAPPAIKKAVEFAQRQVEDAAVAGSNEPFERPGAKRTQQTLAKYALEHCAK